MKKKQDTDQNESKDPEVVSEEDIVFVDVPLKATTESTQREEAPAAASSSLTSLFKHDGLGFKHSSMVIPREFNHQEEAEGVFGGAEAYAVAVDGGTHHQDQEGEAQTPPRGLKSKMLSMLKNCLPCCCYGFRKLVGVAVELGVPIGGAAVATAVNEMAIVAEEAARDGIIAEQREDRREERQTTEFAQNHPEIDGAAEAVGNAFETAIEAGRDILVAAIHGQITIPGFLIPALSDEAQVAAVQGLNQAADALTDIGLGLADGVGHVVGAVIDHVNNAETLLIGEDQAAKVEVADEEVEAGEVQVLEERETYLQKVVHRVRDMLEAVGEVAEQLDGLTDESDANSDDTSVGGIISDDEDEFTTADSTFSEDKSDDDGEAIQQAAAPITEVIQEVPVNQTTAIDGRIIDNDQTPDQLRISVERAFSFSGESSGW